MQPRIRRLGAGIYYGSLRTLRITALARRRPDASVILCYHNVVGREGHAAGAPGLHISADRFERQIRWLLSHYAVVPLREFVGPQSIASSRPRAAITFDDGYAGVFEHAAPILNRLGIAATVFIVADAPARQAGFWWDQPGVITRLTPSLRDEWLHRLHGDAAAILAEAQDAHMATLPEACRPADWTTIRAHISDTIEIGVHSATHRCLPTVPDAELEEEIVASRALIHTCTGTWPEFFSYPYGLSDARVRDAVRKAGYRGAVTLDDGSGADPWTLRRVPVPSEISDSAFEAWTAGCR